MRRTPQLLLIALLLAVLAACGGDDDDTDTATDDDPTTTAAAPTTAAEPDADLPSACALVPVTEVNEATGLALAEGADTGDERRSVCAFSATESGGVGVTVGVEAGSRFDEKADRSEEIFGAPGEPLDGIGDEALFWFTTDEFPEGLSGVLVGEGDFTIDISVQGVADEAEARDVAVGIAEIAAGKL